MNETKQFQERIGRIDGLVQELESASDPALRTKARELIQSVMELHGAGIERILEIVSKAGEAGAGIIQSLGRDRIVSSLMVLYDLHPEDFETRVKRGIDKARSLLASQGKGVDLVSIGESAVRVRITAGGHGCASTGEQLESVVRDALFEAAPDAMEVVIEGAPEPFASGFVPLESLHNVNGSVTSKHPLSAL